MDAPPPKPRRRWLRFSLRFLFISISLFAILFGLEINRVRKQRLIAVEIERSGGFGGYSCRFTIPFRGGDLFSAGWFEGEHVPRTYLDDLRKFSQEYLCNIRVFGGRLVATDNSISLLRQLPNQDWLDLKGSGITDVGAKRLSKMKTLVDLQLYETRITDDGLSDLATMDNLVQLMVSGTGITDAGLKEVSRMAHLTSLGIGSNEISDAGLSDLVGMANVKGLCLDSTNITDAGLDRLASMPNLVSLLLCHTQVSDEGVARFKKTLPKCIVTVQSRPPTE